MPSTPIKLSPSDLTFLWDECPRCFYLKYLHGIHRPAAPFPAVFGAIDRLMKAQFAGRPAAELNPSLPPGLINVTENWLESVPISIPGHIQAVFLRGKIDAWIRFEDGSYGIVDFKTSEPKKEHVPFYSRQLHAYAYALEHPAPGRLAFSPISRLGLYVEAPHATLAATTSEISFHFRSTWLEVPYRETGFIEFLSLVLTLLELPEPPAAGENCDYCKYRQHAREHGM
ncbi:MAG TPA: PD-(D/E)XK nuclease family protein [Anaerolineales bacterium]|nr:PD-(D/E)XK nuclease family protein [Anaerolineales bacterium]